MLIVENLMSLISWPQHARRVRPTEGTGMNPNIISCERDKISVVNCLDLRA